MLENIKQFTPKILLAFLGLLIGVVVLETSLRIYYWATDRQLFQLKPVRTTLKFYDNEIFGSALVPNQKGWFVPHTREYFTWVEVNSSGWPDVGHTIEKPKGTYRILLLGDSFVENTQVPFEKRFFRQLENSLQKTLKRKIEIIALGRGNTGTAQQLLILQNTGLVYKPDIVVHMFLTANDVKNNSPVLQNDPYLPYFKLDEKGQLEKIQQKRHGDRELAKIKDIVKNLRAVELILSVRQKIQEAKTARAHEYPVDYHVYDEIYDQDYQDAWAITKKLILETRKETEESGAKYILVALSNNEQVHQNIRDVLMKTYPAMKTANLDFEKPDKILQVFCKEEKIDCLFMLPFYKNYVVEHPGETTHNRLEGHWNQTGTDLAAQFLFKNLPPYFSIK